jgi:osmotically inducible lipoprotein OsmB
MRRFIFAVTAITAIVTVSPSANADLIGAAAGAGTGLVVAGPVGAVAGGVIGGFFGRPFWGPPMGTAHAGPIVTSTAIAVTIGEQAIQCCPWPPLSITVVIFV